MILVDFYNNIKSFLEKEYKLEEKYILIDFIKFGRLETDVIFGLSTTKSQCKFYDLYKDQIWEILDINSDQFNKSLISYIATLKDADQIKSHEKFIEVILNFVFREVAEFIIDRYSEEFD